MVCSSRASDATPTCRALSANRLQDRDCLHHQKEANLMYVPGIVYAAKFMKSKGDDELIASG